MAPPVASSQPLEWKFSQVFGERTAGEEVQEGIFTHYTVVEHAIMLYLLDPIAILCISCLGFVFSSSICSRLFLRYLFSILWVVELVV